MICKCLQISDPLFKTFPGHTHMLSIIQNMETAIDWIIEKYIQIITYRTFYEEGDVISHFYMLPYFANVSHTECLRSYNCFCPFLDVYNIPYNEPRQYKYIIDFFKKYISQDYYIYLQLNTKYIKEYSYDKHHDPLLYGYDEESFFLLDFINGKYKKFKCSYKELEDSFNSIQENKGSRFVEMSKKFGINCIVKNDYRHVFNINNLIEALEEYLWPEIANKRYKKIIETNIQSTDCFFGNDIYSAMIKMIDNYKENPSVQWPDLRSYAFLCEHKKVLEIMVHYLFVQKFIDIVDYNLYMNEMRALSLKAMVIRNLVIKYVVCRNILILDKIKDYLWDLCSIEKGILCDLLDCLWKKYEK